MRVTVCHNLDRYGDRYMPSTSTSWRSPAPSCLVRSAGPQPIAYQVDDERVLCAPGCLSHAEAQALVDAGRRVGDVQPWTVDLWSGEPDLTCAGCGQVLVQAPPDIDENELAEEQ